MTTRAILLATNRSGSTFLNHALDSHPDIGWERGEPLTETRASHDPAGQVDALLSRAGYQVTGCKVSYRYLRDVLGFPALFDLGITRIIHLYRADAVRTTLSATINTMARDGAIDRPYHTTEALPAARITVDPDHFVSECLRYIGNVRSMKQALMEIAIPQCEITYADIVGGEDQSASVVTLAASTRLCDFLGVERDILTARLRRVNPQPIEDIVQNWGALRDVLKPYEGDLYV